MIYPQITPLETPSLLVSQSYGNDTNCTAAQSTVDGRGKVDDSKGVVSGWKNGVDAMAPH